MTAPLHALGYTDEQALTTWGVFGTETAADLNWPTSVDTYTRMASDPQLAAILKSYSLPIARAGWALDPVGSRPEVYGHVADDLGLPVKGEERSPSGARVRGVRWGAHLRSALAHLTYGHMPFELEAEVRDGRAHLSALYERMPSTLATILPGRNGDLVSVTQHDGTPGRRSTPIPADHLQWYVHDRKGAAWQGTSLLRPAFGPWLHKKEMMRVLGISSQRFGTGIMSFRPATGTNPTQPQLDAAALQASKVRVGNQAGMAPPPGFVPELIGLSGTVPDTLGYLKYLDQQMSRMALVGHLDLGDTPNGSRALGEAFVDSFLLALQDIADSLAEQVTTQTVARIVEWNWGTDEPVPAVVCEDVGARHEVTAEALGTLLGAGALSWDPMLEEYVRTTWKLPARDPDAPPAQPTPVAPGALRVAARARARGR